MKYILLFGILAAALPAFGLPQPRATVAPLLHRANTLSPRQDSAASAASVSALISTLNASPQAFMSSVTSSCSTTALSTQTQASACDGIIIVGSGCCPSGIYVDLKCFVVPGAEELQFTGVTDSYVDGLIDDYGGSDEDDAFDQISSFLDASSSRTPFLSSTRTRTPFLSSTRTPFLSRTSTPRLSSLSAASEPTATSQSGDSNGGHALETSFSLMVATFLGLVIAL
ncbi:hypothetical protein BDZ90DRAFT_168311 [Jaminaea rosea]|uniref:Hydrophobin n=1 Tax=Jaminaea rosea TaxID=1569628 RepID=A0A316UWY1_9BASI|nr:hypothetical protein BDZ90DRAFT_168311 [Jaminaea rosea]PWN27635.1 hypothetical protein BDZ90DRAFT_168311 [Jaminaea rosea]